MHPSWLNDLCCGKEENPFKTVTSTIMIHLPCFQHGTRRPLNHGTFNVYEDNKIMISTCIMIGKT